MTTKTRKFKVPTKLRSGYTLMLRTCRREDDGRLTSHGGFVWPAIGAVECPAADPAYPLRHWDPTPECGNGLHGFLRGVGSASLADWSDKASWLVVEVRIKNIINLNGKIKVPRGRVLYSGDRLQALELMARLGHLDDGHMGGVATAGDGGTATAGDRGTATAGYRGTATAGDGGTATAGYRGTATAGDGGTATAGDGGTMQIKWWDGNMYRISTAYIGEDNIEAGRKYQLNAVGKFVAVETK
jgi:hypothetical protein